MSESMRVSLNISVSANLQGSQYLHNVENRLDLEIPAGPIDPETVAHRIRGACTKEMTKIIQEIVQP